MKDNTKLMDQFLNRLYGSNKSKQTIVNYEVDLKIHLKFLDSKGLHVTDVGLEDLEAYAVHLKDSTYGNGRHYSESTIARRISSMRSFYNYLAIRKIIKENPSNNLESPAQNNGFEPEFIEEKDMIRLNKATEGETHEIRDGLILGIFTTTGIRLSELHQLDVEDISDTSIRIQRGKGNKSRTVFISKRLAKKLASYTKDKRKDSPLFTSQKGGRLSTKAIQTLVKKYMDKIGLDTDKLTTHSLRHSFASNMLKKGVDIVAIQKALGHSSLETTQKYAHTLDSTRQEAANLTENLI